MTHEATDAGPGESRAQFTVHLGDRGRLVLPAAVRRSLGFNDGDRLVITIEADGTLRLASLRDRVKRARGLFANVAPDRSLVDELIEDRREEALQEGSD